MCNERDFTVIYTDIRSIIFWSVENTPTNIGAGLLELFLERGSHLDGGLGVRNGATSGYGTHG